MMVADDMFDDGEPEPSATGSPRPGWVGAVEAFEDPAEVFFCDPDALITDSDLDLIAATTDADRDASAGAAVGDRILHEVSQRSHQLRVASIRLYAGVAPTLESDLLHVSGGLPPVARVVDDRVDRHGRAPRQGVTTLQT